MLFLRKTPIAFSTRARREPGLLPRPAKRGEGWGEGLLCAAAPHPSHRVAAPFSPLPAQSGERAPAATPRFHFAATLAPQSSFAPEALIIAVHLGISDLIYAANSSGVPPMMSTPRSPSDVLTVGSSSAAASARLSVAITSLGVCAGATRPCQVVASKFLIPSSSMVGISGKTAVRLRVATASG